MPRMQPGGDTGGAAIPRPARREPPRRPMLDGARPPAGVAGAALVCAFPPAAQAATPPPTGAAALAALLLVAVLAAAAGALWMRQRTWSALYAARRDAQALSALVDACRWTSDAHHRVQAWQAGAGVAVPAWAEAWCGQPLWDGLESADAQVDLRTALESRGAIAALPVRPRGGDPALQWTLRAWPQLDADGRFAGHLGTLAPRAATVPAAVGDDAALDALLQACPGPVWLAMHDPALPGLRVRHCNDAALRLAGGQATPTWAELVAALPGELPAALERAQADAQGSATQGRWRVRLQRFASDGRDGRLLALWPAADDDAAVNERETFSYAVSHDLRAPIRVVEGFTRILKEDYGHQLDRIGNDHLDRVLGAAARMNHMIDTLLALARIASQPLSRQPVNLSQLAGFVVDDLRRNFPAPPADVTIEPGMVVQGDPTLLRMALENLLGNAWKYSARRARRVIAFERARHDGADAFVVRDNGAGFDMRFADRLFGVFQRLHSASEFPGTGIGLASVKRIVLRHGGRIWADGEVDRGASFHFTLDG